MFNNNSKSNFYKYVLLNSTKTVFQIKFGVILESVCDRLSKEIYIRVRDILKSSIHTLTDCYNKQFYLIFCRIVVEN